MSEPKSEEERIQHLLNRIFELRKMELMNLKDLVTRMKKLDSELEAARTALIKSTSLNEIKKWTAVLKSYSTQKLLCSERRYIVIALHQDEARLEKELMKMGYKK